MATRRIRRVLLMEVPPAYGGLERIYSISRRRLQATAHAPEGRLSHRRPPHRQPRLKVLRQRKRHNKALRQHRAQPRPRRQLRARKHRSKVLKLNSHKPRKHRSRALKLNHHKQRNKVHKQRRLPKHLKAVHSLRLPRRELKALHRQEALRPRHRRDR